MMQHEQRGDPLSVPPRRLTKADLMGDRKLLLELPAYQLAFPFTSTERHRTSLAQFLAGTTLRDFDRYDISRLNNELSALTTYDTARNKHHRVLILNLKSPESASISPQFACKLLNTSCACIPLKNYPIISPENTSKILETPLKFRTYMLLQ